MTEKLLIKKMDARATLPVRGDVGAAGLDVCACLPEGETITIRGLASVVGSPQVDENNNIIVPDDCRAVIPLGMAMMPPDGTYIQAAPRSGLSVKNGIHVMAGVIDATYRGDVGIVLINLGGPDLVIKHGDRIAQIILKRISLAEACEVDDLPDTDRGTGGFGSTGVSTPLTNQDMQ